VAIEGGGHGNTHPHEANELLIADGFVGLVNGGRTVGRPTIAKARVPAAVVVPAFVAESQSAVGRAARALRIKEDKPVIVVIACGARPPRTRRWPFKIISPRMASFPAAPTDVPTLTR
jgi:hypothetical protein